MQILLNHLHESKLVDVNASTDVAALVRNEFGLAKDVDFALKVNGKLADQKVQLSNNDVVEVSHILKGAAGSGSLSQLASFGSQNSITQSSSLLPFKCSITKPAPFSIEPREIQPTGTQNYNKTLTFSVHYSSDMFTKCYLVVDIAAATPAASYGSVSNGVVTASHVAQVEDLGHAMIEELTMEIGAVTHLQIPGEWLHVWDTMSKPYSHRSKEFTGRTSDGGGIDSALEALPHAPQRLYIELPFWFNDYCNAVPLVALHLSDIKFKIKLRKKDALYKMTATTGALSTIAGITGGDAGLLVIDNIKAIGEYIFLPDSIRNTLATIEHYQLIKQIQKSEASIPKGVTQFSHSLDFNHMCSEFVWYGRRQDFSDSSNAAASHYLQYFNFSGEEDGTTMGTANGDFFSTAQITLNSNERVMALDPKYYRLIHPVNVSHTNAFKEFVYCYSFALEPEKLNPSGTLNCSRIENIHLNLKFSSALAEAYDFFVFAINYNVCRISSGVSSLSFSS